jgi:hypothetical protein
VDDGYTDDQLELAQVEYEQELAKAEAEAMAELKVNTGRDIVADQSLAELDAQIKATRDDLLREKAKLAVIAKQKELIEQEKRAKSTVGRIKAKLRGKIAPALIGLGVLAVVSPLPISYVAYKVQEHKVKQNDEADEKAKQDQYFLDGKESTLDPGVKGQIESFNRLGYTVENRRYTDEFKRVRTVDDDWSGAQVFEYMLDGEASYGRRWGYYGENFPRYRFDIRYLEKPLTLEQMERVIDIYQNIRPLPKEKGHVLRPSADPKDVEWLKKFILRRIVKPYLESEAGKGKAASPELKGFVERLGKTIGGEFDAWVDDLLKKKV